MLTDKIKNISPTLAACVGAALIPGARRLLAELLAREEAEVRIRVIAGPKWANAAVEDLCTLEALIQEARDRWIVATPHDRPTPTWQQTAYEEAAEVLERQLVFGTWTPKEDHQ